MKRIDYLLIGYFEITVEDEYVAAAATELIKSGLSAKFMSNKIHVYAPLIKKYKSALANIPCEISEIKGLPGIIFTRRRRYGIIAALIILFAYYIFAFGFVWDVRIDGNEKLSDSAIESELEAAGLYSGMRWENISLNEIEGKLLDSSKSIGWVNINRRGCVAYVTVKEKTTYETEEKQVAYSNILAVRDCVIEEISVKSGVAMVSVGDAVKQGQLLISGIVETEFGTNFVRAEGEVIGRTPEKISVEVPWVDESVSYGEEVISSVNLEIFNFSINIFKNYSNLDGRCVIIKDTEECFVFERYRLPVKIVKTYNKSVKSTTVRYTESEITSIAASRLAGVRLIRLADAQLLKIKTYGEFTDNGYRMTSDVTVLRNVGEEHLLSQ